MRTRIKPKPIIEKETYHVPCRIYGCFSRADYRIGNMTGSPMVFFHVCEDCLESILNSKQLIEKVIEEDVVTISLEMDKLQEEMLKEELEGEILKGEVVAVPEEEPKEQEPLIIDGPTEEVEEAEEPEAEKDIFEMSYKELQDKAMALDIKASGKHEELLARIQNYMEDVIDG